MEMKLLDTGGSPTDAEFPDSYAFAAEIVILSTSGSGAQEQVEAFEGEYTGPDGYGGTVEGVFSASRSPASGR